MIKKILAIDDQPDNLTTYIAVIKNNFPDCEVLTALSGKEGIKIAKKETPDTILLDIIMPEMDGYETCKRLKEGESTKNIPVIMITAIKTDSKSRVKGLNMGADAFLSKPIDTTELSAQINVMLRIKAAEDRLRKEKDVLDLKIIEKAEEIIHNEEKFRSIFNAVGNGIAYVDNRTKILDINPAFCHISGVSKEELIGKSCFDLARKFISIKQLPSILSIIKDTLAGKLTNSFEIFHSNRFIEISLTKNKIGGYFIGIIRDVTERNLAEQTIKESEESNRLLIENAPYCIHQVDDQSKLISMNKVGLDMMEVSDEKDIVGMHYLDTVADADKKRVEKLLQDALKGKLSMFEFTAANNQLFSSSFVPIIKDGKVLRIMGITQDITERKEREKELLKLSTAVEQSPSVITITDLDGKIEYTNPKFTELTGYTSKEALNNKANILRSGEQSDKYYAELWNAISSGKEWRGEFHNKKKNGELFWEAASVSPIFDKEGIITNYIKVAEDITEQKQMELQLKGSEERFKSLMQQSPFVVEIYDLDGLQISVNKAYEELWGFPAETTVNSFNVLKSKEVEETGLLEYVKQAYNGKYVNVPEYSFDSRGETEAKGPGRIRWLSTKIYPIKGTSGKVKNIVISHQDITDRKNAEEIQKVLFNISHAVNTTDNLENLIEQIRNELGKIIDTNNFYVALYDRNTDTLSFPYYNDEHDHFTTAPAEKTLTKYVIETKKSLLANIALKKKFVKEGILKHVGSLSKIWLGVPLKLNDMVTGVFALQSYTDENAYGDSDIMMLEFVSEQISLSIHRKKAEDNLKIALHKAEESDRLKSAFLANMSHEIRTPMNGILGFTSLLRSPDLNEEQLNKYTGIIEKSGDRLLNIINDLLDISKIEANQMELSISECNVNEQIDFLFTFFKPEANSAGLELNFNTGLEREDSNIDTDREKIYAILTNLIKNAIKYTHKGSIEFGYKKKKNELEFYVKDTGIGIHETRQKAVFERFVQADIEDIEVYEGAGLGLSITKAYVEMLGGKIWLESEEGVGSTFYFSLPYSTSRKEISLAPAQTDVQSEIFSKKIKLLIAEDDNLADEFLTIITKEFTSTLLHAKNGKETIDLCKKHTDIDVILMDIKMPVLDGLRATMKIREFNKDVIIIAQTAFALAGDKEKAIAAGCDDYITKPIDKDELIKMISKHIK